MFSFDRWVFRVWELWPIVLKLDEQRIACESMVMAVLGVLKWSNFKLITKYIISMSRF